MKEIKTWKKVFESDLKYLADEVKSEVEIPSVIFLEGTLGAGKTSFVQASFRDKIMVSPTYSILTEVLDVLHGDLYRIESEEELIHLEIEDYLENKDYVFLEWGHKYLGFIDKIIPENFKFYLLKIDSEKSNCRNYDLFELQRD